MESRDLPITIGSAIFRIRESRSMAVGECASRSGLTPDEWSSIEAGNSDLPIEMMWRIADALDLRASELMRVIERGVAPDDQERSDQTEQYLGDGHRVENQIVAESQLVSETQLFSDGKEETGV